MLALLAEDKRITPLYDFSTYSDATKLAELSPLARIPSLKELGQQLAGEIDSPKYRDRPLNSCRSQPGRADYPELLRRAHR